MSPLLSKEEWEKAKAINTPKDFDKWFKQYFSEIFKQGRIVRPQGEEIAQFLVANQPDWIPLMVAESVRYLQQITDLATFKSAVWTMIGNPIVNAQLKHGLNKGKSIQIMRTCTPFVQLLIDKINAFGWNANTLNIFVNSLSLLNIRTQTIQTGTVIEKIKKKKWFGLSTEEIEVPKEVKKGAPRPKEEILAELRTLL